MSDNRKLVQEQYAQNPGSYVNSRVHAKGRSLLRLAELVQPEADWRVLDIATGGGTVARTLAPFAGLTVASDLTFPMLASARDGAGTAPVEFTQADATRLPYKSNSFDLVTCRIAAHHFPDVHAFLTEAARVIKQQTGVFALVDNVSSGEPRSAKDYNTFEALRDPSHNWAYSIDDWVAFMAGVGLRVYQQETLDKEMDFDGWAARMNVIGNDLTRLRALLVQGTDDLKQWLQPQQIGERITFTLTEAIFLARVG